MYRSHHDPNMTRAIARQDEALEDLIRSTRQVIQKHSTYLAHNNDGDDYSYHRRRSHATHKPRLQPLPPPPPPQRSHRYCENVVKLPPPTTRHHHHHHIQPQSQQPSYQQPFPTKSRTKTWLNKIIPSKLQCETDDEIGLHDLKKKIHKQKSKQSLPQQPPPPPPPQPQQQLPFVKTTNRPMIIPSVSSSPEKVVVVDVPADTTVILRSLDADDSNCKRMAAIYHITDINIINQLFGHVQITESKSTGDIKANTNPGIEKMSKSHTMQLGSIRTSNIPLNSGPHTASSTSSSATVINSHERSHQHPPLKKPKEMSQYMSMPTQLSLKAQEFNYMDSDASTVGHRGDNSSPSMSSTASSFCYDERPMKHERLIAVNNTRRWMR